MACSVIKEKIIFNSKNKKVDTNCTARRKHHRMGKRICLRVLCWGAGGPMTHFPSTHGETPTLTEFMLFSRESRAEIKYSELSLYFRLRKQVSIVTFLNKILYIKKIN